MFKFKSKRMEPILKPGATLTGPQTRRVRDLIMIRSHSLPLGRCCPCPKGCYKAQNVRSVYCTCGLLAVCSVAVLVGIWTGAATWYYYSKEFLPTTCTPLENSSSTSDLSAHVCSCVLPGTNDSRHCRSAIPCIQVWIVYKLPNGDEIETILHETVEDIRSNWQCSHIPATCFRDRKENVALMEDFRRQWGDPWRPFPCYYHPTRSRDVVRVPGHRRGEQLALHGLLWPGVCSIVFFVGMLVPMLICGCQYIWGNRVPGGIMSDPQNQDQTIPLEGGDSAGGTSSSV